MKINPQMSFQPPPVSSYSFFVDKHCFTRIQQNNIISFNSFQIADTNKELTPEQAALHNEFCEATADEPLNFEVYPLKCYIHNPLESSSEDEQFEKKLIDESQQIKLSETKQSFNPNKRKAIKDSAKAQQKNIVDLTSDSPIQKKVKHEQVNIPIKSSESVPYASVASKSSNKDSSSDSSKEQSIYNRFTQQEKDAIMAGADLIDDNVGFRWKKIKEMFPTALKHRSTTQIKDCFRTINRQNKEREKQKREEDNLYLKREMRHIPYIGFLVGPFNYNPHPNQPLHPKTQFLVAQNILHSKIINACELILESYETKAFKIPQSNLTIITKNLRKVEKTNEDSSKSFENNNF